jgi:hypothetical protein
VKHKVVGIAFLFVSANSAAAPIYLTCAASSETETHNFSLALDEDNRKITHTDSNGSAFNSEGFFTATEISYQALKANPIFAETKQYKIDRTDLSVTFTFRLEATGATGRQHTSEIVSTGKCQIVDTPKRKI